MRLFLIGLLAGILSVIGLPATAQNTPRDGGEFTITVLSTALADATAGSGGLISTHGEWGFSALIEAGDRKILYDTGFDPDLVFENAEKLGLDLSGVTDVVLSHNHVDHSGGLLALRERLMQINPEAMSRLHVASGMLATRRMASVPGQESNTAIPIIAAYEELGGTVIVHDGPVELAPGIWLTGPVPRVHEERHWSPAVEVMWDSEFVPDFVPEDMALVIETPGGLAVISGCGHAGIINIADHAMAFTGAPQVAAAIGGFHLVFSDDAMLAWTAAQFERIGLTHFIGAHCTGVHAVNRLAELTGLERDHAVLGAVGQRYSQDGISPGLIAR